MRKSNATLSRGSIKQAKNKQRLQDKFINIYMVIPASIHNSSCNANKVIHQIQLDLRRLQQKLIQAITITKWIHLFGSKCNPNHRRLPNLSNWWAKYMILWGVHCSRWHELPHCDSRVTNDRQQFVARGLALSSICSRDCRRGSQVARLCIHGFHLLLQLLFFCL